MGPALYNYQSVQILSKATRQSVIRRSYWSVDHALDRMRLRQILTPEVTLPTQAFYDVEEKDLTPMRKVYEGELLRHNHRDAQLRLKEENIMRARQARREQAARDRELTKANRRAEKVAAGKCRSTPREKASRQAPALDESMADQQIRGSRGSGATGSTRAGRTVKPTARYAMTATTVPSRGTCSDSGLEKEDPYSVQANFDKGVTYSLDPVGWSSMMKHPDTERFQTAFQSEMNSIDESDTGSYVWAVPLGALILDVLVHFLTKYNSFGE